MTAAPRFRYLIECGTPYEKHVWFYDSSKRYDTTGLAWSIIAQLKAKVGEQLHLNHVSETRVTGDEPVPVSNPVEGIRVWTEQDIPVGIQPRLLGGR